MNLIFKMCKDLVIACCCFYMNEVRGNGKKLTQPPNPNLKVNLCIFSCKFSLKNTHKSA